MMVDARSVLAKGQGGQGQGGQGQGAGTPTASVLEFRKLRRDVSCRAPYMPHSTCVPLPEMCSYYHSSALPALLPTKLLLLAEPLRPSLALRPLLQCALEAKALEEEAGCLYMPVGTSCDSGDGVSGQE